MYLELTTKLAPEGIECHCANVSQPGYGRDGMVATIKRVENGWTVCAYAFRQWEMNRTFESLNAAQHYALALAYEMVEGTVYRASHKPSVAA